VGDFDVGGRHFWSPVVVAGPPRILQAPCAMDRCCWNFVDVGLVVLDVETMSTEVHVDTEHPLHGYLPVRAPVWWGWRGEVAKRCTDEAHSGRIVVLRIEKQFNRFERVLAKVFRAPNEVLRPLDSMNSLIWELADGHHDFQSIVQHLNDAFHEEATPVVERSTAAVRGFVALGVMKLLPSTATPSWSTDPGLVPEGQTIVQRPPDMDQWS